ncbi:MAG: ABC transporter ATP-binding protein [Candidatus Rokuibacteriota bacterium]|nr:MAG: ABC transporter ATP-binding protein [Candidatus Rokubacteria bacterium]
MSALLEVHGLEAFYGRTKALHGVSFSMAAGGITTILGANGAGKTTTLRAISRMVRTAGTISFEGQPLEARVTEDIVQFGIAHAPEGRGTFVHLTVEENLKVGAWGRRERGGLEADFERVFGYFPVLRERRRQMAGTLSGGEQQMLCVARALMLRPRLLLLDEPSLGLAPLVVREIFRILRTVNQAGVTILLVEQNAALALDLADHVFLLETGRVVLEGPSDVLRRDDAIRRAYLGY